MNESKIQAADVAKDYYNSEDADNFYATIWGGEDIHVGIYETENDKIFDASKRTQERMLSHLGKISANDKVIDLGSGYGGAARYLAKLFNCRVTALNLSDVENKKARQLNKEKGYDNTIEVIDGYFEDIPFDDNSFDIAWSQDAFLHSPDREQVIKEVSRILKPGGKFIFTDPMQSDQCPEGVLDHILRRIHLSAFGSPGFYESEGAKNGLKMVKYEDLTIQLRNHYATVLKNTEKYEEQLVSTISSEYIANMKSGLRHWVEGAEAGYLAWGIFYFVREIKPHSK
ncbi:SAM-dependent methyltransferase [Membranihabitans maritimus]|uniref:SAM-dependent methyltransferase n=1 Tax=Membranihabitans maritimus TaxID=2904244 RepID=UPI001EFFD89D|nr:class I SAM-dependent methyltransferase [Membranihabitans maritimus]